MDSGILSMDSNAQSFFWAKINEAQERQNIKLKEGVEFYLVNLLCQYVAKNLDEDCLALLLKKALESEENDRIALFKQLGDTSLYFSGFFQEFFDRKCFSLGYYVDMGRSAYLQLGNMLRKQNAHDIAMSEIYLNLNNSFPHAIDILCDVAESTAIKSDSRSTLSIYDAWLNTASEKLEKDLVKRGVYPFPHKKDIQ